MVRRSSSPSRTSEAPAPANDPAPPEHLRLASEYLAARGVTPETAQRAGIVPVASAATVVRGFKAAPALVIPYFDPRTGAAITYAAGGGVEQFRRVRYLALPADGFIREAKPQRFAQPKGSPIFAYFARGTAINWPDVFADPAMPVVIVEGEIKALSACAHGIPVIGIGGVWNIHVRRGGPLLPELDSVVRQGRRVIICFDSDLAENPHVTAAARRLTEELRGRGADVRLAQLPAPKDDIKQGLDDFIVRHGVECAKWLLQAASEAPAKSVIVLARHRLNENLTQLDDALSCSGLPVFQRSGTVVHVAAAGELGDGEEVRRAIEAPVIREVSDAVCQQLAMKAVGFERINAKGKRVPTECPRDLANHYLQKADGWKLVPLRGIVQAPTLRPDGSVLQTPGYDAASGFLYLPSGDFPEVPKAPTRDDAARAVQRLYHLVRGFEFASEEAKAVFVAAVMTAVVRRALRSAPLFAFSAPVMGAGKTLAADLVSIIATGHEPAAMSQGRSAEEDRKRLLSVLMRGDAVVQIDNCEVPIEGDALCAILTSPEWQDRVLGQSAIVTVPTNVTFLATGNNLTFRGDMSTRALMCRIVPKAERPEERPYGWDARAEARANRPELVVAVLAIIRAYHAAGRPAVTAKPFGRFEEWQSVVQHPLLWLGAPDPCATRELVERNDPEREAFGRLVHLWGAVFGGRSVRAKEFGALAPGMAAGVAQSPEARAAAPELYELACELSGSKGRDVFDAVGFGKYLVSREDRQTHGHRLVQERDKKQKVAKWRLEAV